MLCEFIELVGAAFERVASGKSKSGTPKCPIDERSHPDSGKQRNACQKKLVLTYGCEDSPLYCWDHATWTKLGTYRTWFTEQPDYKRLFVLAAQIKAGAFQGVDRKGRTALAAELVAASQAAFTRYSQVEGPAIAILTARKQEVQAHLFKRVCAVDTRPVGCCALL